MTPIHQQCYNQINQIERIIDMCEYCKIDNKFSGYGLTLISKPYMSMGITSNHQNNEYYLVTNEYEELSHIHGLYSNSPFRSDKVSINYCPICGRNLKGE